MKRKKLLLFTVLLSGLCLAAYSQLVPPKLIFTEFAMPGPGQAHYYELTNMETVDTINLWDFNIQHYGWWQGYPVNLVGGAAGIPNTLMRLRAVVDESEAMLAPGESFVISAKWEGVQDDGAPIERPELAAKSDLFVYIGESGDRDLNPEDDSVSAFVWWIRNPEGDEGKLLWWKSSETDSIPVDGINNWINPATNTTFRWSPSPVAGVEEANRTHTFIRKANITQGTLNWNSARGNDLSDAEWMPVLYDPTNNWNPAVFSSVGNHGVYDIQMTSETVDIDMDAGTMTIPWGIRKGSWQVLNSRSYGIFAEIEFGDGMAWNYVELGDTATSACQTGDTVNVYAFGNNLAQKAFRIIVEEATINNALAIPKRHFDDEFYNSWLHGASFGGTSTNQPTPIENRRLLESYFITENVPGMDTIGNVPYATRTDSLLANVEIAPNASTEFIFVDGNERVDLMEGDILRITAEDGTTMKDYYLKVEDIAKSTNANLSAITWPDRPDFVPGDWKGDTLPKFNPNVYLYTVVLPFGTSSVPALVPFRQDLNSTIKIQRATTLNGTREDMTTTFTVTSQDTTEADGNVNVYKITFELEKLEEHLQPYHAEPFFSQITWRIRGAEATFVEIANVGNQPMNLENYMIGAAPFGGTPAEYIVQYGTADSVAWRYRYNKYVPGFRYGTLEEWRANPAVLIPDPDVDPILEPGDCFVLGRYNGDQFNPENPGAGIAEWEEVDLHWSEFLENHMGEMGFTYREAVPFCWRTQPLWIMKILNPAVLEGTKPMTDPADFELIDLWGDYLNSNWTVAGLVSDNNYGFNKKPEYPMPNTEQNGGFGTNAEDSHWIVLPNGQGIPQEEFSKGLGFYSHDPITLFMSTVSSIAYVVDPGYEGELHIEGVNIGSIVDDVIANLIPADTGQDFSVISATTGLMLLADAAVTDGDTLKVVSADMVNTTKYVLGVAAGGLEADATLTAKEGSGLTITIDGETGTIEGIPAGSTIADVLGMVEKSELAVLNVIDGDNNLIPLKMLNPDTMMVDTRVMGDMYFEVVAQNQIDIITYKLMLDISASDAWVTSNLYDVSQENFVISLVPEGIVVELFLENLIPSGNATMELLDKIGMKRDSGYVVADDIIRITSEDQSMSTDYSIRFLGAPLRTLAYVTSELYMVDETLLEISEIPAGTGVGDFLAGLKPAPGAIIALMDGSGNMKEDGNVISGDKVQVVAEDGETEVLYTLDVMVSVGDMNANGISIYPNPASDVLFISGLKKGSSIHLTSIIGQKVRVIEAVNDPEQVSLEGLAKGYYIINVIDSDQNSTLFRFVKK